MQTTKVLIFGKGLLATAILKLNDYFFADLDLTYASNTNDFIKKLSPDIIINCAALVGGVKLNSENQEEMFYVNNVISSNVIHAAVKNNIKKIIAFGSTCSFDESLEELNENNIQFGLPYFKNYGYGYAKRMTEIHLKTAKEQYGLKYNYYIPCTLYGPNDNFNLDRCHVIPALIHKCFLAKKEDKPLIVFGDKNVKREVMFSEDFAQIITNTINEDLEAVMVSVGQEVSVEELVFLITDNFKFTGKIIWESSILPGQLKRPVANVNKIKPYINFKITKLEEGIKKTINWFENNYPGIRK